MWLDILLVVLVTAALLAAVIKLIRDRRRGKCSCGCSACDRCSGHRR